MPVNIEKKVCKKCNVEMDYRSQTKRYSNYDDGFIIKTAYVCPLCMERVVFERKEKIDDGVSEWLDI